MRTSHPCDGCALRRVRCWGGYPCNQCQVRSLSCTFLRTRRKRGPKGPRSGPGQKVERLQRELLGANNHQNSPETKNSPSDTPIHRIPLEVYQQFLELFRRRLYSVWPVVSHDDLVSRLQTDESDFESYSLAAALCAAVIAQLRLPEHMMPSGFISSTEFAAEAQRLRQLFEHREDYSLASLLTSFFLHIYFANVDKLRTAGFFLREALTYAHGLRLHQPDTYSGKEPVTRQVMLCTYWILFVSERTYCVQHGLPVTLKAIDLFPDAEMMDGYDSTPLPAFLSLARLFTYLEGHFLEVAVPSPDFHVSNEQAVQISNLQNDLCRERVEEDLNESQRVDIFVTRSWIRILLWQYTISHFAVSCRAQDDAFSAFLPASVAYDMLSLFAQVSRCSIEPHGYGMELKIFRIADSLLDVLACTSTSTDTRQLLLQSRDSLHSLENVLLTVGGTNSQFLARMRQRMAELDLPIAPPLWAQYQISHLRLVETEEDLYDPLEREQQTPADKRSFDVNLLDTCIEGDDCDQCVDID